jgi:hypothetical protein
VVVPVQREGRRFARQSEPEDYAVCVSSVVQHIGEGHDGTSKLLLGLEAASYHGTIAGEVLTWRTGKRGRRSFKLELELRGPGKNSYLVVCRHGSASCEGDHQTKERITRQVIPGPSAALQLMST